MTRRSLERLLVMLPLALLPGCSIRGLPAPASRPSEGELRWIVVEKLVGDLVDEGAWPEAQMQPGATMLAMAPVRDDVALWTPKIQAADYFVEVLAVSPEGRVEVGQVVTVSLRVGNAKPDAIYRLIASCGGGGTRILGEYERVVKGMEETKFRFTRVEGGLGVIRVDVEVPR